MDAKGTSVDRPRRAGAPPPQFSLLTLLKVMSALGALFGVMASVGALWSWAVVLLTLLVIAHLAAAWLGTRLRDEAAADAQAERERGRQSALTGPMESPRMADRLAAARRPDTTPTQLQRRRSLGWTIPVAAVLGAIFCAALAAVGLAKLSHPVVPLSAHLLGAASGAVLGGIWGFLGASFCRTASLALGEASRRSAARAADERVVAKNLPSV